MRRHPGGCARRSRPRSAIPTSTCSTRARTRGSSSTPTGDPRVPAGVRARGRPRHPPRPAARSRAARPRARGRARARSARSAPPPGSRSRTRRCAPRRSPSSRELRDSRARIVEAGDAERRRLERNLHDGAQQRLLALSYDLRLARAGAAGDGEETLVALLDAAGAETTSRPGRAARARPWHLSGDPDRGGPGAGARDARRPGAAPGRARRRGRARATRPPSRRPRT